MTTQEQPKRMAISPSGLVMVFIAACMMSAASLMLRGSIDHIGGFALNVGTIHKDIFALLLQPLFILGVVLYGGGTLLWMRVIASEPLSVGYPILLSIAFIAITLGAAFFFGEKMSLTKFLGMVLIISGVIITTNG
ncbi:MAG: hypothetical protein KC496_04765 [Anaerolineae bacterium]|nr:hypothetical protein [Anaerolineae bacterium]